MMLVEQAAWTIAVVFVLAGVIKGTVGIGLPTVSVGMMTQFVPPHTAIAVVVLPLLFSNFWQVYRARIGLDALRDYWPLILCMVVSLWLTTFFTVRVSADVLLGVIGTAIVIFAATSLARTPPQLSPGRNPVAQTIAGISAGIMGGFTSIWAPPIVTFLIARRASNEEFIRATGLILFIGGIPLAAGFWQTGLLNSETGPLSALMILPTLLGFTIGEAVRKRLHPDRFRAVLLWVFLLMGVNLLRRAFF